MTMTATYDYSAVMKWAQDLTKLGETLLPLALQGAATEAALFFEREAKLEAPFDTGRLKASIGHGPEGIWAETFHKGKGYFIDVGTNVEYAPYMEYGFTMSSGHVAYIKGAGGFRYVHPFSFLGFHYMQKAATRTEAILESIIARHMDMAITNAGF